MASFFSILKSYENKEDEFSGKINVQFYHFQTNRESFQVCCLPRLKATRKNEEKNVCE